MDGRSYKEKRKVIVGKAHTQARPGSFSLLHLAPARAVDDSLNAHVAHARQPAPVAHIRASALAVVALRGADARHGAVVRVVVSVVGRGAGAVVAAAVAALVMVIRVMLLLLRRHGGVAGVRRHGAAAGPGVGPARRRRRLGRAVRVHVVDGRQADARDAAVVVVPHAGGTAIHEPLAAGVGACRRLEVLDAVGHAL